MNDMQSLFPPSCRPSKEQRDFIFECGNECKEVIFEGAKLSNDNPSILPYFDKVATHTRKQLVPTNAAKNKAYAEKYKAQLACIIEGFTRVVEDRIPAAVPNNNKKSNSSRRARHSEEATMPETETVEEHTGMFEGDAGNSANWKMAMTTIVGGVNRQHPHSDFGLPESFSKQKVFPFLTLHGFGIDSFQLWLLPDAMNTKYGFLHAFAPDQIVFLRGDFVHAGVPSAVPRGHMKFFPLPEAGWTRYGRCYSIIARPH
jgi:hypothetical protein